MRRKATAIFAGLLIATSLSTWAAEPANSAKAPLALKVGDQAPEFKLPYFDGTDLKYVSLDQYRGKKNVVLAFYVFAFTGG